MSNEEIKTLIEQEAERRFKIDATLHPWNDPYRSERKKAQEQYNYQQVRRQEIFKAGADFALSQLKSSTQSTESGNLNKQ
jgi:5,10-methylenetetrahydrofolate reductase